MKALVTGSTGFIGSFLVEKLLENNISVRCLIRKTSNLQWIKDLDIELVYGELLNKESLKRAVENINIIYHLAGVTKGRTLQDYLQGNYVATVNLLEVCNNYCPKLQKFIYISSQAAAGPSNDYKRHSEHHIARPISNYGKMKYKAEQAVLEFGKNKPVVIIRPPSVYGPRDKDFLVLFKTINKGILPVFGKGKQKISIVHVFDLIDGIMLASVNQNANGQIYYFSDDNDYTFKEISEKIAHSLNKKPFSIKLPFIFLDISALFSGIISRISKKFTLINEDKISEMKQNAWLCSCDKAINELGYKPKILLQEGLKNTAQWYLNKGWITL